MDTYIQALPVMSSLRGKSALVTGAPRGIGAAIARRLAHDGARVWVDAVEELEQARTLAAELNGELVEADVSDPDQVDRMLKRTGPLDVLVNNAADQTHQPVLEVDRKTWDRTLAVNLAGPMLLTRDKARSMPAGGAIVNVASIHAFVALRGAAAYTASKAALRVQGRPRHCQPLLATERPCSGGLVVVGRVAPPCDAAAMARCSIATSTLRDSFTSSRARSARRARRRARRRRSSGSTRRSRLRSPQIAAR